VGRGKEDCRFWGRANFYLDRFGRRGEGLVIGKYGEIEKE